MIRKILWEQRINEKREYVFLVAGQILQVQEDLSLKTVGVLLVPFYPEGDYNFVSRECPCYGKYADDFWHKFDEIQKINGEHFFDINGKSIKIINYDDVNFNSIDNPVIGLEELCVNLKPNKYIKQLYAIVLDYNKEYFHGFSWDCLDKFIHIFEKIENMEKVLYRAFMECKYCYCDSHSLEELDEKKDKINFLNLKVNCPRMISIDERLFSIEFNLFQPDFEYKDLLKESLEN